MEKEDDKYEYIIINTILDVNRVLNHWCINNKNITYEDKISLFKSWFARHFKSKFNYQVYLKYIKKEEIIPTIIDNKLINIDIYTKFENIHLKKLKEQTSKISFVEVEKSKNILDKIDQINKVTEITTTVNYEKLLNIKFA